MIDGLAHVNMTSSVEDPDPVIFGLPFFLPDPDPTRNNRYKKLVASLTKYKPESTTQV